ncbi:ParB/RepB/Spo0J family partition protein [Bradyrhizobium elkanii]|uniref:ParB/RepB/Spo0J family partition protein n=1 Tax=Bradyrhizobium elkanii TaxID=29448 RepID=UPI0004ADDA65|nr:ParB/RepB/Spo0J family partition protein [Bradyrhizobium elkanii]WLA85834.1 ParB/RepB/Spo0J family partition protein [Bradyrhizobium elkanii]
MPARYGSIPISAIRIVNPRDRFEEPFTEMVRSIARVGLKRPITVSDRDGSGEYELVCGQGRIEAFAKLKATEIPAIVTNLETEDCILLSLVENIARRQPSPVESVSDIGRLAESYDTGEIAAKLGVPAQYVKAVRYLLRNGHHNLIKALERRAVTPTMAFEIARANTPQLQAALLRLYKSEKRSVAEIAKIRKLFEQRKREASREGCHTWRARSGLSTGDRAPQDGRAEG